MRKALAIALCFVIAGCGDEGYSPVVRPSPRPAKTNIDLREIYPEYFDVETQESRDELAARLWQVPLGRMYNYFLTANISKMEIIALSNMITDRLLSEPHRALTKISMLQWLAEDLYVRNLLDDEAESRLLILEGNVSLHRVQLSKIPIDEMALHTLAVGIAAIPFGWPAIRQYLFHLGRWVLTKLRLSSVKAGRPTAPVVSIKSYQPEKALSAFLNIFGFYSLIYLFWHDWSEAPAGILIKDLLTSQTIDEIVADARTF